jgi:predicted CXXCH cytochrome family protein
MAGGQQNMPPGKGLQGTDLSDDHPISFEYSAGLASQNGELAMPGTISNQLPLDQNGQLQCTTCHDPHDSPYNKLLRLPSIGSQICVECHQQTNWQQSSHSQSFATWSHKPPNPWPDSEFTTVSDNGCGNCHKTIARTVTMAMWPQTMLWLLSIRFRRIVFRTRSRSMIRPNRPSSM